MLSYHRRVIWWSDQHGSDFPNTITAGVLQLSHLQEHRSPRILHDIASSSTQVLNSLPPQSSIPSQAFSHPGQPQCTHLVSLVAPPFQPTTHHMPPTGETSPGRFLGGWLPCSLPGSGPPIRQPPIQRQSSRRDQTPASDALDDEKVTLVCRHML